MAADVVETVWYQEDSASPITVSKPASFGAGQILIAVIIQHNNPSAQTDLTTPTGWTLQGALDGTTSDGKVFSYAFTGSDPATWNFPYRSTADVCLGLFRITGADTTPTIVVASTPTETVATPMDSPTVTPSGSNDLLICVLGNHSNGTAFTETDPAGMTDLGQVQVAGNFFAMAAAKEQLASSSPTGVRTWSSISPTGLTGGTLSIAVKSSASTVAPPPYPSIRDRPTVSARPTIRRRVTTPPPVPPVIALLAVKQPRELRALPVRRGHAFMPIPAQVNVPNPNIIQVVDRARLRFVKFWRNRGAAPVTTQQVLPPTFVPQPIRVRVRSLGVRRHDVGAPPPEQPAFVPTPRPLRKPPRWFRSHLTAAPPAQAAPVAPAYPPQTLRARIKGYRPSRGHTAAPPAAQTSPPLFERIRRQLVKVVRGKVRAVVPAQVIVPSPPYSPQPTHVRRALFVARRRKAGVEGWMAPGVHSCTTPRPSTGATTRPNAGTTLRATATTTRPATGVTSRPNTGTTVNPC